MIRNDIRDQFLKRFPGGTIPCSQLGFLLQNVTAGEFTETEIWQLLDALSSSEDFIDLGRFLDLVFGCTETAVAVEEIVERVVTDEAFAGEIISEEDFTDTVSVLMAAEKLGAKNVAPEEAMLERAIAEKAAANQCAEDKLTANEATAEEAPAKKDTNQQGVEEKDAAEEDTVEKSVERTMLVANTLTEADIVAEIAGADATQKAADALEDTKGNTEKAFPDKVAAKEDTVWKAAGKASAEHLNGVNTLRKAASQLLLLASVDGRLDQALHQVKAEEEAESEEAETLASNVNASVPTDGGRLLKQSFKFSGDPGFTCGDNAVVQLVAPEGQAAKHGVQAGWTLVEVDMRSIQSRRSMLSGLSHFGKRLGSLFTSKPRDNQDNQTVRLGSRISKMLKPLARKRKTYSLAFLIPAQSIDSVKVDSQEKKLKKLNSCSFDERKENLEVVGSLSKAEASELLERTEVASSLLQNGADELTLLFQEKTVQAMSRIHRLWEKLRSSQPILKEDMQEVDLSYTDSDGDTALHMASTPEAASLLVERAVASCPDLLMQQNSRGELPLESMLRRAQTQEDRMEIIGAFRKHVPGFTDALAEKGTPLSLILRKAEQELLPQPCIPWSDVRAVLLAEDVRTFLLSYAEMSKRLCRDRPDLDPADHHAVWSGLLSEHVFGALHHDPTTYPGSYHHSTISLEYLGAVFHALQVLLRGSIDVTIIPDQDIADASTQRPIPHTALKQVARGLFRATMGPADPAFDPREPYREAVVQLVHELQNCIAARVSIILKEVFEADPKSAETLMSEIPANELHNIETKAAEARMAPARLRMDSELVQKVDGAEPIEIPLWVLQQKLDVTVVNGLKDAGAFERARDLMDLSGNLKDLQEELDFSGRNAKQLSENRLRFAQIHAAWVWHLCAREIEGVNLTILRCLGLDPSPARMYPCKGIGGVIIQSFRARSEPKGIKRILEKIAEALQEEAPVGKTPSILALQPTEKDEHGNADDVPGKEELMQAALQELLTPACYICDIIGAEVSLGTIQEIISLYNSLRRLTLAKDGFQIVRTKNGYSKDATLQLGGYRDLKVWAMINMHGTTLIVELQLHLKSLYDLKKHMHMSYECYRGSFDHPYLWHKWHLPEAAWTDSQCHQSKETHVKWLVGNTKDGDTARNGENSEQGLKVATLKVENTLGMLLSELDEVDAEIEEALAGKTYDRLEIEEY